MKHLKLVIIAGIIIAATLGATAGIFLFRAEITRNIERATLPQAVQYSGSTAPLPTSATVPKTQLPTTKGPTPTPATLPAEINLAVPFTVQAPHANWNDPYGEFCEEASVLMAMRYVNKQPITSPEDADAAMLAIKAYEDSIGYAVDTTAAETSHIITDYFKYPHVQLIQNPTIEDIKAALAAGKPVIVPAAGRDLGNPYFQTPGPLYHMLVIKGYTKSGQFITNDPGTRHGADYLYNTNIIMSAIHDWRTDSNIELGKKVILVVG